MKELHIEYDKQRDHECCYDNDLDKELITIIPKMNQLDIKTFSSCSGCGIKHLFNRSGFIAINKMSYETMNDLFYRIFTDAINKNMKMVKAPFRSRVSTMVYHHDADRTFFVIKAIGNWWKFSYDIKKFWEYLENILDKMIDEAFSFECLLCGETEKPQSEVCFVCQDCYDKKKDKLAQIFENGDLENVGRGEFSKVKFNGMPIKQFIRYLRERGAYNNKNNVGT